MPVRVAYSRVEPDRFNPAEVARILQSVTGPTFTRAGNDARALRYAAGEIKHGPCAFRDPAKAGVGRYSVVEIAKHAILHGLNLLCGVPDDQGEDPRHHCGAMSWAADVLSEYADERPEVCQVSRAEIIAALDDIECGIQALRSKL